MIVRLSGGSRMIWGKGAEGRWQLMDDLESQTEVQKAEVTEPPAEMPAEGWQEEQAYVTTPLAQPQWPS